MILLSDRGNHRDSTHHTVDVPCHGSIHWAVDQLAMAVLLFIVHCTRRDAPRPCVWASDHQSCVSVLRESVPSYLWSVILTALATSQLQLGDVYRTSVVRSDGGWPWSYPGRSVRKVAQ